MRRLHSCAAMLWLWVFQIGQFIVRFLAEPLSGEAVAGTERGCRMTDNMTPDEVLDHIQRSCGCSRRQARAKFWEAIRSGQLPVYGINREGVRERIPPDFDGHIITAKGERIGTEN
jgi:hypothetical protein